MKYLFGLFLLVCAFSWGYKEAKLVARYEATSCFEENKANTPVAMYLCILETSRK